MWSPAKPKGIPDPPPGSRSSGPPGADYALLTRIVDRLCTGALSAPEGAVLVFLPGAGEISRPGNPTAAPPPALLLPLRHFDPPMESAI